MGATIRIGREIQCLPYAGFSLRRDPYNFGVLKKYDYFVKRSKKKRIFVITQAKKIQFFFEKVLNHPIISPSDTIHCNDKTCFPISKKD